MTARAAPLRYPARHGGILAASLGLLLACLLLALGYGETLLSPHEVLRLLAAPDDSLAARILWELRLPRALAALAVGGLLALAGALMQVLLRNPLADPYVLGISGGAGSGALLALLAGAGGLLLSGAALAGALLSTLLVFGLARRGGNLDPVRLLLTGIVVAAGWGALISFILVSSPDESLRGMLFWLMGDLSYAVRPGPALLVLALGLLAAWPLSRSLNLLVRGEIQAGALGVDTARLHALLFGLAALLTAAAVMQAGGIGFVGLVVPHLLRLAGLRDHRLLLPAAVALGASLLLLADTLARGLLAPRELPVGILTAALGVPVFLYLLNRRERPAHG